MAASLTAYDAVLKASYNALLLAQARSEADSWRVFLSWVTWKAREKRIEQWRKTGCGSSVALAGSW